MEGVSELKGHLAMLVDEIVQLEKEITDKDKVIAELRSAVSSEKTRQEEEDESVMLDIVEETDPKTGDDGESIEYELSHLQSEVERLKEDNVSLATVGNENRSLRSECEFLQRKVNSLETEKESIHADKQSAVQELQREVAELREKVNSVEEEKKLVYKQIQDELEKERQQREDTVLKGLDLKENEINALRNDLETLRETSKEEKSELKEKLTKKDKELEEMTIESERSAERARKELSALQIELENSKKSTERLRSDLNTANEVADKKGMELSKLYDEFEECRKKNNELRIDLDTAGADMRTSCNSLSRNVEEKDAKVRSLEREVADMSGEIEMEKMKREQRESELSKKHEELLALKGHVRSVEAMLKSAKDALSEKANFELTHNERERKANELKLTVDRLSKNLRNCEMEKATLMNVEESLRRQSEEYESELKRVRKEKTDLVSKVRELQRCDQQNSDLVEFLQELADKLGVEGTESWESVILERVDDLVHFQQEMSSGVQKRMETLEKRLQDTEITAKSETMISSLNITLTDMENLRDDVSCQKERNKQIDKAVRTFQEELKEILSALRDVASEENMFDNEKETVMRKKTAQIAQLRGELLDAKLQLRLLKSANAQLETKSGQNARDILGLRQRILQVEWERSLFETRLEEAIKERNRAEYELSVFEDSPFSGQQEKSLLSRSKAGL